MGMLDQSGPAPTSEAPLDRPTEAPVDPTLEGEAQMSEADSDVSDDAVVPLDEATQIVYSDTMLPKLIKMFESAGPDGFPKAMGTAILGVMQKMEGASDDKISDEVLAEVGAGVFEMLAEDLISSGTVEGVTPEIMSQAIQESIKMWGQANPERFDVEVFEREAMAALEESGEMPPVTANPEERNMAPDEAQPQPAAPQGGGMLLGGR
jgi:hypothetical protein